MSIIRHAASAMTLAIALAFAAGPTALAAAPADELRTLAHVADEAQIHGDRATLERLVADDFTMVGGSGARGDKAHLIGLFTDPAVTLEPYEVSEAFLKPLGDDAAILGGMVTMKGLDHGKPYSQTFRYADTWLKRSGRWQIVYTQVTNATP
jgi:hypothetical protein